jgi:alkylation response protein AidB-like acyl-CoA dehydrogenase
VTEHVATPRSVAEVRGAVDDVLGLVAKRADDVEGERRLPDDLVLALRRTGINRLGLPVALGGLEATVVETIDIFERIAAVDGSTGWCAVIGAGSNVFAGYITEAGARVVFADPDLGSATMFAPCGKLTLAAGRRLLRGRWPFASNVLHSGWIGLGALVEAEDGTVDPVPRVVFVPVGDVTIEDTWDALGLRGTGSHHVSVTELEVDLDRSCTFADQPWPIGTLWRLPLHTVLFPVLTAVPLGIARGALDEIAAHIREGRVARRGQIADDPVAVAEFADADSRLRAARALLRESVAEAHAMAERGDAVDRALRARVALACLYVCDTAVAVTSVAHNLGGGDAAYVDSPLPRALRDVETARQHLLYAHKHRVELGKALAGLDVVYPPFLV